MPFFMNPLAFYATAALLVVAGVYLFRRQSRDIKVSALMFYAAVKVPAEGGRKVTLPQTPLILLVELLILTLVIFAAADPRAIIGEEFMPLVVILDDSFSMRAGDNSNPKSKATRFLDRTVFSEKVYRVSLIRAGTRPEFIGRRDMLPKEASLLIENWRCNSPLSDLDEAVKLAGESFNPGTRILVLTDSAPQSTLSENIGWYAFGEPVGNLAITAASRYPLGNVDRCFIEFSNLSEENRELQAVVTDQASGRVLEQINWQMPANSIRRLRFSLKNTDARVNAKILSDSIEYDNEIWLMPVRKDPLKVAVAGLQPSLRPLFENTLNAAENAELVSGEAEMVITSDVNLATGSNETCILFLPVASDPMLVRGTVTSDRTHFICEGLPEVRGMWAIETSAKLGGYPLLSVGDRDLFTIAREAGGQYRLSLNILPEYSTIQRTSFWPVIFWNVFNWRQSLKPGPTDFNFRSGMEVTVNAGSENEINLFSPSGRSQKLATWKGQAGFVVDETGLYRLSAGPASWTIAVNLTSARESDLTDKITQRPDNDGPDQELLKHSSDVRWWFIIPALLLLLLHQWLVSRRRQNIVY